MPPLIMMVPYKKKTPIQIEDTDPMVLAVGPDHSAIVKNDGSLWLTGRNNYGQLGTNNTSHRSSFFNSANSIYNIAVGESHSTRVGFDERRGTGRNSEGQLGLGNYDNKLIWSLIGSLPSDVEIIQATAGMFHTALLSFDGRVFTTGWNGNGQLGAGNTFNRNIFGNFISSIKYIAAAVASTFAIKNDGSLWITGFNRNGNGIPGTNQTTSFVQVPDILDAKIISAYRDNALLIREDGSLWGCGNNVNGELGLGHNSVINGFTHIMPDVKQISCGDHFSFTLKNDGTLLATGRNSNGQLGTGDKIDLNYFVPVLSDVQRIDGGATHSIAIKIDGTVWVTGSQLYGKLGNGINSSADIVNWTQIDFNAKE